MSNNNKQTSAKVASIALGVLRDPKATAAQKSAAASSLAQARTRK